MTPKYWFKIVFGMLAIFVVGMVAVSAVNAGKSKVEHFVDSAEPLTVPLMGVAFRTAKGELGKLNKLRVERSSPREISGFHLTVTLNEGVDVDQFDYCEVTVGDPEHFDEDTAFDCLTAANPGFEELVEFGSITFRPSGERHRLMVPQSARDSIRVAFLEDEDGVTAQVWGDSAGNGDGSVKVEINGKRIVDIQADSAGGHVRINDPDTGKPIVDVKTSN
jgi:hypothetical protein